MQRLTVGASFVGWDKITHIIDSAQDNRTKLLIMALFLTGGRTQETLSLEKKNFDFKSSKHSIIVNDMKLDKKFKVVGREELEELRRDGKPREKLVTEKLMTTRDSFPILLREPFALRFKKAVINWRTNKLFPGLSRQLSYYYVTNAGKKAGIRVSDHWFRGQRTSHLKEEYLFDNDMCSTFIGWTKKANIMADHYGSTTWKYLETKMAQGLMVRQDADDFLNSVK